MESKSNCVGHGPCSACGSKDNNGLFDDGHTFCFGCEAYTHGDGEGREVNPALRPGEFAPLRSRGLRADTLRVFDYKLDLAKKEHLATYYDKNSKPVAQKIRRHDKSFLWVGDTKKATLFGQQCWQSGGRKVVVTEGELDAMSMSQVQGNRWPVVSIKDGASSAVSSVRQNLEWLSTFDQVVFMFDSDEPGQAHVLDAAALLPPGKAAIAKLPLKDANAMLVAGREKELVDAMWRARIYRPDGIVLGSELWDVLQKPEVVTDAHYPYTVLDQKLRGLRKSEVVTFCAGTGIGKSTVCREIAYSLIQQGHRVGYVALEETQRMSGLALLSLHMNRRLHLDPCDLDDPKYREAYLATIGKDQVAFYNHFGTTDSEALLAKMRYLVKGVGCEYIILDHISIMASGDTDPAGERVILDRAMTNVATLTREVNCGMIVVCHLRKSAGKKSFEEGGQISLGDLRGTAAIAQLSDGVVALERNQQSGNDLQTIARVLKSRFSGYTGLAGTLEWHEETGRLEDVDSRDPFESEGRDGGGDCVAGDGSDRRDTAAGTPVEKDPTSQATAF